MFHDGLTVGIDLGTAYSSLAVLEADGTPQVVPNAASSELTASVLAFGKPGMVSVGEVDTSREMDPDSVVSAIKRQMGSENYRVSIGERAMSPEFLSALILRKLKQDAEKRLGSPIANAVITVPYYFNEPCRRATRDAGQIAGLNVVDIINEPTAATLAYAWLKGELGRRDLIQRPRTILLYDLGGGTFDVTVVRYTPTHFAVLATDGDTLLGGLDWTNRLADFATEQLRRKFQVEVPATGLDRMRLVDACERTKQALAEKAEAKLIMPWQGREIPLTITRHRFEELTADLLQRTMDTTELVLRDGQVKSSELDEVLLVGGSTHMPAVHEMLKRVCGRVPSTQLDPRLAVAQGAAIHAAILQARESGVESRLGAAVLERLKAVSAQDVNSHSLGVELVDPLDGSLRNHIMIPRNSALPTQVSQRFVTSHDAPRGIRIRLLEGEAEDPSACAVVGEFRIAQLPAALPAGSPVDVHYEYDAQRKVHVTAKELVGNNSAEVHLVWESGIQPSAREVFVNLAHDYRVE